jgi:hypothetical protein
MKCSLLSAINEMQIKISLRFYLTPARRAIVSSKKQTTNADEDAGRGSGERTLKCCSLECKLVQPL